MNAVPSKANHTAKWHLIILVSLMSMVGPFSIDTYLPAFESMEADLGVNRILMTKTLGAYLMAFGASTLVWGAITDWIGRKPVMIISLGSYFISSAACALASDFDHLLWLRVFQGLGVGGALIAGRAMVRDVLDTKDAQKAMAYVMMLFSAAPALAPVIGGWLHDFFGWRSIFWFLAIYGIVVMAYAVIVARESLPQENRSSIRIQEVSRVYLRTLQSPRYLRLVFILAFAFASFFVFIAGAPTLLFDVLGLEASSFYVLFVPMVSGIMLGAVVSNRLIHFLSSKQILTIFITLMLAISIFNWSLNYLAEISIVRVIGPLALYSFGLAVIMPVLTIEIINCFPNNRGSATAMQSFIQMVFNGITASFIVASLGTVLSNFIITQIVLILAAVALWLYELRVR
ncbi:multidrug effflux MFS transporter [Cocleimonas sp. KMM 6892]|uniref:multidrug effflux MFS transporter n=1 Tax=unclassified Cocleimonas TaxID=2639732 RepID=UPI002DB70964|nr:MULTISPECIES: multidrug effflux MFS transporter [unclassified Cocleimonas]MEB8432934.1 multidrug effflux MFS transporter [Cocleimonas sp. KMM 6892]MEC4716085.1 multidrug effflux MFS transporter [Cocleimonas sp. KMM 6895]MEC4745546.1 multidrug effflux MFS transporter [Cocleimonas sp. KMM 6896]